MKRINYQKIEDNLQNVREAIDYFADKGERIPFSTSRCLEGQLKHAGKILDNKEDDERAKGLLKTIGGLQEDIKKIKAFGTDNRYLNPENKTYDPEKIYQDTKNIIKTLNRANTIDRDLDLKYQKKLREADYAINKGQMISDTKYTGTKKELLKEIKYTERTLINREKTWEARQR